MTSSWSNIGRVRLPPSFFGGRWIRDAGTRTSTNKKKNVMSNAWESRKVAFYDFSFKFGFHMNILVISAKMHKVHLTYSSSAGNVFRVTGPLWGESTGHRWIPLTKASGAKLWYFLDLRLNKRLSKQTIRRWFQTTSRTLWRRCNEKKKCLRLLIHAVVPGGVLDVSMRYTTHIDHHTALNTTVHWRHHGRDGVLDHRRRDWLFSRLFRRR